MFSFECPFCKIKAQAKDKYENQSVNCPKCGEQFTIVKIEYLYPDGSESVEEKPSQENPEIESTPKQAQSIKVEIKPTNNVNFIDLKHPAFVQMVHVSGQEGDFNYLSLKVSHAKHAWQKKLYKFLRSDFYQIEGTGVIYLSSLEQNFYQLNIPDKMELKIRKENIVYFNKSKFEILQQNNLNGFIHLIGMGKVLIKATHLPQAISHNNDSQATFKRENLIAFWGDLQTSSTTQNGTEHLRFTGQGKIVIY